MSYRRSGLGMPMPGMTPTTWFAGGMEPFAERNSPPGSIYAPYGWGSDFMVGMPLNYTHHIDYVPEPGFGAVPQMRANERHVARQWTESPCHSPGLFRHASESCAIWQRQMAEARRLDLANAHRRVPGARPLGPMRDTLAVGNYDHGQYEGDMQSLGSYYETSSAPSGVRHQRRAMGDDSGDGLSGLF